MINNKMKTNKILTQQSLKELSKSIAEIAKILGEEAAGIECKSVKVGRSTDEHGVYHVDIAIRLSIIDGEINEAGEILEKFTNIR